MCWELDYRFFAELQEARAKQRQRNNVIRQLLNDAIKQGEKADGEEKPAKEIGV